MSSGTVSGPVSYQSVYRELRRRAKYFLSAERPGHTLQPTDLVHEAWVRMTSVDPSILENRAHFLALVGKVMRNLLVDYARSHNAKSQSGSLRRVDLPDDVLFSQDNVLLILQVNEFLEQLALVDKRAAEVVEMKFFAGLTEDEIGNTLGCSVRTVKRDWSFAKLWIRSKMGGAASALPVGAEMTEYELP